MTLPAAAAQCTVFAVNSGVANIFKRTVLAVNSGAANIFNGFFETRKSTQNEQKNAENRVFETRPSAVNHVRVNQCMAVRLAEDLTLGAGGRACPGHPGQAPQAAPRSFPAPSSCWGCSAPSSPRWRARPASRARPPRDGSWPEAAAPDCPGGWPHRDDRGRSFPRRQPVSTARHRSAQNRFR